MADYNLFMVCKKLNKQALTNLPMGYSIRTCRRDEFKIWAAFPFDDDEQALKYYPYMEEYFSNVYDESFFDKCIFVCDNEDKPVATCFIWKSYNAFNAVHWFKTLKEYEGKGIGRALLSNCLQQLRPDDFPIYLHTHPESFRAIKLYNDFGFELITDKIVGYRENHLNIMQAYLKEHMPENVFNELHYTKAPKDFLQAVKISEIDQF